MKLMVVINRMVIGAIIVAIMVTMAVMVIMIVIAVLAVIQQHLLFHIICHND